MNLDMELFGAHEWQLFISGGSCLVITSWSASGIHEIVTRPAGLVNKTTIHCPDRGLTTRADRVHGVSIVCSSWAEV